MEEREDLRIRRTRKFLSEALLDLLSKEDFSKITVNDICDMAMVHRATFYNHFTDKEDLLNYTLDGIQEELFAKSIENITFATSKEMYMNLLSTVFDFLTENKVKIISIIKNNSEKLTLRLVETIKRSISYLIGKNQFDETFKMPTDFIINFYSGGLSMLGLDWIEHSEKYTKENVLQFIDILFNENVVLEKSKS